MNTLKRYRAVFARIPTAYSPRQVVFIRAINAQDARGVLQHHIEKTHGVTAASYVIESIEEQEDPPLGFVEEA